MMETTFEWLGNGMMRVTRTDIFGVGPKSLVMPEATLEQVKNFDAGEAAQRAFPGMSPNNREFIINGLLPAEYEEIHREVSH